MTNRFWPWIRQVVTPAEAMLDWPAPGFGLLFGAPCARRHILSLDQQQSVSWSSSPNRIRLDISHCHQSGNQGDSQLHEIQHPITRACLDQIKRAGGQALAQSKTHDTPEGSTMNAANTTTPFADEDVLVLTGEASQKLGQIVVTPAALAMLEMQGLKPQYLLGFHECTEVPAIDELNEAASRPEMGPCKAVLSRFETACGPILVSTELQRDGKNRLRTRVMLPTPAPETRPSLPTPPTPDAPAPE
jgi:hypothetical protein